MLRYDRRAAVEYAHKWAYGRNPQFYDYEMLGGDCTNFASQCLLAGGAVMNYEPTYGWFYISANRKAPAWTGVEYLYNFLLRDQATPGPMARLCGFDELQPGDLIQISFTGLTYRHSPIVVSVSPPFEPKDILVAAHSVDSDNRALSTYAYQDVRLLHILDDTAP